MSERLPVYDLGYRQDEIVDGDIVPVEWEPETTDTVMDYAELADEEAGAAPNTLFVEIPPGVSVSLAERAAAIRAIAKIYATYARAQGLEKAKGLPWHRSSLDKRYPDVDEVAAGATRRARAGLRELPGHLDRLVKPEELIAHGFDPVDVATDKQILGIQLRQHFGPGVGASARNARVNSLYDPSSRKQKPNL